jgi:N-methylhydantoinase B
MAAERPEIPVFDMGPPLEEILARCEEETGLPAPSPPVDVRSAAALRGRR